MAGRRPLLRRTSFLAVLLSCVASGASAQDMVFVPSMSRPEAASISQFGLLASQARKRVAEREAATSPVPLAASKLTYVPSPARRRANYARLVERSRGADPASADGLAATLAADPIAAMAPQLAGLGLSTSNVADAYAVYWVEAWQAAQGESGDVSRAVGQAVSTQAAGAILAMPSFASLSDAQKQEFGDALLVQALLIGAAKEQANGDPAKLGEVAAAVRSGAKAFGLDLDAMTLTEQGFVSGQASGQVR